MATIRVITRYTSPITTYLSSKNTKPFHTCPFVETAPTRTVMRYSTILTSLLLVQLSRCYKILLVANVPFRSHHFLVNALAKGLANAGHDVTIITSFEDRDPPRNGTYRSIVISKAYEFMTARKQFFFDLERMDAFQIAVADWEIGTTFTRLALEEPKVLQLLASGEHFDVVIVEQWFNDALKALAHHFNAPLISFSTIGPSFWSNPTVANPSPPSYVPEMILPYGKSMGLSERCVNFLLRTFVWLYREYHSLPIQDQIMKRTFPDAPNLSLLYYNVSIVLVNYHESVNQPVPFVPSMIQIGGFHIDRPKGLPSDLQEYLDGAREGFVYFSMGSNIRPSQMRNETVRALIGAFEKLKMRVLWKWDGDTLWGKPRNVMISKWFPQNDILAHPNVKLFITHGGLLSSIEATYHGVPMLAFPIFGDQKMNARKAVETGIGLKLDYLDITEGTLAKNMREILDNPKYRDNVRMRSKLFHDRPVRPMDLAIYWVEFVARHRNADHLKVAGLSLPWYKYLLLDVVAVLILVAVSCCWLIYFVMKKVCLIKSKKEKIQ